MDNGWKVDNEGRRYREIAPGHIEFEPTIVVDGIEIYQSDLEEFHRRQKEQEARRKAAALDEFKNRPPTKYCPFNSSMNNQCKREGCVLFLNGGCSMKVDAEELEQVIFQTIKAQLEAVLSIRMDGSICLDTVVAERTEYEKQIEALEDSKQSLFEQYIMGEMDAETYKSEKAAYDAAILKAKNAYAAIAAQAKKKKEELNRQSSRTEVAKAITDAERLTPELVSLLIDKVYVFPGKRIEIAYKVQDLFD